LNGEFEVEPAYGEKREEALRIAGLKTYFITKVLKPVSYFIVNIILKNIEPNGDAWYIFKRLKLKHTSPLPISDP
jgi:hypothetical protein